jgi:transcriptional regulator with PAS, ATPase and Fis domain
MTEYAWPGNVRELRNVIERIMILENKERIEVEDLPSAVRTGASPLVEDDRSLNVGIGSMTLEEMERWAIGRALEQAGQNQVRAARLLGISRDTLRYRMKKFGLLSDPQR